MSNPCRGTEIHVTSLWRGTGRFLIRPLKYCCETAKVCQPETSYRRWWNARWSWSSFNCKSFRHTLPRPLQSSPGNVHMEVKVLLNGFWNSCSEMLQMAQGSPSCVVLNCYRWEKKMLLREKCLCGSEPFYIHSKYYSCSFPLLLPWYPRHLPTVAAYERLRFSWNCITGIRLCCPNIHSTCIDLPMFIFIQAVGYCFHETRARCAMLATRTSWLAQGKPALHCISKAWACPLLATGVRGGCAASEWERLVDWFKTSLKNQLACKLLWFAVTPRSGYLPLGFATSILLCHSCSVSKYQTYLC